MSAYATSADVTRRIAAAAAVDPDVLSLAIDDAATEISLDAYGERALLAHVYLSAHIVACRTGELGGLSGGAISAKSFSGGISVSYAVAAPTDPSALASTTWGREYVRVRDSIIGYATAV